MMFATHLLGYLYGFLQLEVYCCLCFRRSQPNKRTQSIVSYSIITTHLFEFDERLFQSLISHFFTHYWSKLYQMSTDVPMSSC
jgi:hypothetical protein